MSVYNKSISPGSIGIGGFGITNVQNAIVDCIAESLLPFFGPQMPWESDMAIWKCDASIDNNLLNESWEWNNNVNPDQNYSEYLAIAKKRLQDKFNNDSSIYGDTINFNIEGAVAWNQPE